MDCSWGCDARRGGGTIDCTVSGDDTDNVGSTAADGGDEGTDCTGVGGGAVSGGGDDGTESAGVFVSGDGVGGTDGAGVGGGAMTSAMNGLRHTGQDCVLSFLSHLTMHVVCSVWLQLPAVMSKSRNGSRQMQQMESAIDLSALKLRRSRKLCRGCGPLVRW